MEEKEARKKGWIPRENRSCYGTQSDLHYRSVITLELSASTFSFIDRYIRCINKNINIIVCMLCMEDLIRFLNQIHSRDITHRYISIYISILWKTLAITSLELDITLTEISRVPIELLISNGLIEVNSCHNVTYNRERLCKFTISLFGLPFDSEMIYRLYIYILLIISCCSWIQ